MAGNALAAGIALVDRDPDALLFRRAGADVTASMFLAHAHALAADLPDGGYVVNLCRDRYAFAVTLVAAVLRQRPALLTGDRSSAALASLAQRYPGCIVATDLAPESAAPESAASKMPGEPADQALPCILVPSGPPAGLDPSRPPAGLDSGAAANPAIPANQLAAIVFTSGSTGAPSAHNKTWGGLAQRSRAAGAQFGLDAASPACILGTVPPQHMYGFETTVLLPLHAAASSWCGPGFFPQDISSGLAAMPAPRILVTTPLQLRGLLGAEMALPALHAIISATAPLDAALARAAETRWSVPVLEIFGATEVGSIASRRTVEGDAWRLYPGVGLTETSGEAVVSAAYAPDMPLADEVAVLGRDGFRLLGRRTDIVKLGGHRASLTGLNRILAAVPGVQDGVFIVPDDIDSRSNARLLAMVVAPGRDACGILAELRASLDPLFVPRRVVLVAALPRNELGKLPREAVLALLARIDEAPTGGA